MNIIKSYLTAGTKDSVMRLGFFVLILCASIISCTVCFMTIYAIVEEGRLKDVSELIKALAFFITGLLGPVSIGKSIQSFSEKPYYEKDGPVIDTKDQTGRAL